MPGGSVNGRPFRETADSFSRTGIPCGNPKRYQSREVMKMGVQNQTALSRPLTGPVEDIETEGDRQLQTLLHKQLNTNITLKDHFSQHKRFSEAVSHQPATDVLSGTFTLDKYQQESRLDQYVMELKHCGLNEDEIDLKLEDMGMPPLKKRKLRVNLEPGIRDKKIDTINDKISAKRKELERSDNFSGARAMGRHEMDLEKSIAHNSNRAKFLNCLLTTTSSNLSLSVSEDPMDHLPDILAQMSERGKKVKNKKKHHQQLPQDERTNVRNENDYDDMSGPGLHHPHHPLPSQSGLTLNQNIRIISENKTKIPDRTDCSDLSGNNSILSVNQPDMSKCNDSLNKDSDIVRPKLPGDNSSDLTDPCFKEDSPAPRILSSKVEEIPLTDIIANKLSVEEIKEIPRFQDYHPGVPSKVLYVKNLPVKVREEDLVCLFIRFQKTSQLIFRLLTGRMRGQAFITFNDEETASEALDLLNGYMFKGKPIIIQFGKKQNSNS